MPAFAVMSAAAGALAFALLAGLALSNHKGSPIGRALIAACLLSTLWLGAQAAYLGGLAPTLDSHAIPAAEALRNLAWLLVIGLMLRQAMGARLARFARPLTAAVLALTAVTIGASFGWDALAAGWLGPERLRKCFLMSFMLQAVLALVLLEQIYRNADAETRWSIKHLCIALGAIFGYEVVMYADGVLFNRLNEDLWIARGAINALAAPLIGVSAARNRSWQLKLFVSRQVAFHSAAVLATGIYLLAVAVAGYYVKAYGGHWGGAIRVALVFAAGLGLAALASSGQLRSTLRGFLARHFYRNKHDYGEVWLNFTHKLAGLGADGGDIGGTLIRAIADIMDSTGGVMWKRVASGDFIRVADWAFDASAMSDLPAGDPLVARLRHEDTVIDLRAEATRVALNEHNAVPVWMLHLPRAWLLVPIVHQQELLAFVLLAEPRSGNSLNWEDRALLRTLGSQAASYLALIHTSEALADARQFEAYNRLSAFVVHDLKNVVGQLSLVLRNAERHRTNPEFVADAFNTIGNAVVKMNRMLSNLRTKHADPGASQQVDLAAIARDVVRLQAERGLAPQLEIAAGSYAVRGDRDQLSSVLEHLLQNARDAAGPAGRVALALRRQERLVVAEIADNGCGMTADFIVNRLFKPFDTTKGKAGMGIGVYESLHIVNALGGQLGVESTPGEGTTFRIELPAEAEGEPGAAPAEPMRGVA